MELKSLLIGLAFTVGIFAVKSGAGVAYLLRTRRRSHFTVLSSFTSGYGVMFFVTWLIVTRVDFLAHLDTIMHLFKGGMVVHFIFAALLLIWGKTLLTRQPEKASHGWLMLVLPCPVCFTVFLCSAALLESVFAGSGWTGVLLFAGYLGVSGLAAACLSFFHTGDSERLLGAVMIVAALYFLLTVLIVPHFSDIERIYRLSRGRELILPQGWAVPLVLIAASFTGGVIRSFWRPLWK